MICTTNDPIDPGLVYDLIAKNTSGSVLFHYAVVKARHHSGEVTCHIEYSPVGNVLEELETIAGEMGESWDIEDALLIRRTGRVAVGEIISLVAVSSPSSEDAFASCSFAIGRLKKMNTIAKKEICA